MVQINDVVVVVVVVVVVTDHKPLEVILNNPRHKTSIRLQRMLVRRLDYDFKIEYRPGKTNISDYTSRLPTTPQEMHQRGFEHP